MKEVGYNPVSVVVGEVVIAQSLSPDDLHRIKEKLQSRGFGIAEKSNEKIVVSIGIGICI